MHVRRCHRCCHYFASCACVGCIHSWSIDARGHHGHASGSSGADVASIHSARVHVRRCHRCCHCFASCACVGCIHSWSIDARGHHHGHASGSSGADVATFIPPGCMYVDVIDVVIVSPVVLVLVVFIPGP